MEHLHIIGDLTSNAIGGALDDWILELHSEAILKLFDDELHAVLSLSISASLLHWNGVDLILTFFHSIL